MVTSSLGNYQKRHQQQQADKHTAADGQLSYASMAQLKKHVPYL